MNLRDYKRPKICSPLTKNCWKCGQLNSCKKPKLQVIFVIQFKDTSILSLTLLEQYPVSFRQTDLQSNKPHWLSSTQVFDVSSELSLLSVKSISKFWNTQFILNKIQNLRLSITTNLNSFKFIVVSKYSFKKAKMMTVPLWIIRR